MKSSEFIVENHIVKYKDGFSFRNEGGYWWIYFNGRNYEHGYKDVDTAKAAVDQWIKNGFFNPLSEGWKSKLAGAALATGIAASPAADAVVLNPARPINAQGGTVANPYPQKSKPSQPKIDAMSQAAPVAKDPRKKEIKEGVISGAVDKLKQMLFGKKALEHNLLPITEEQRDLIRQHFRSSNVNIKYGNGEYVIKMNVHAEHGRTSLAFYNDNGQLMCGIAHWSSLDDRLTKGRIPIMHTTHAINNPDDIEKIKVYGN